jgi:hypothetical protein
MPPAVGGREGTGSQEQSGAGTRNAMMMLPSPALGPTGSRVDVLLAGFLFDSASLSAMSPRPGSTAVAPPPYKASGAVQEI